MRARLRYRFLALGMLSIVAACSDSAESPIETSDAGAAGDAGTETSTPVTDASNPPLDGGAEADAVVPTPRTCTAEGWCHTTLPEKEGLFLRGVWADGQGVAWTVSESGKVLRWDGSAWSVVFTAPGELYAVWGSSATDLWIGGANGLFHGTGATSSAITFQAVDVEVPIYSIWGTSSNDVWAVGYAPDFEWAFNTGRVLHFTGGTGTAASEWIVDPVSSTHPELFNKVWGTSDGDVWTAGEASFSGARALHRVPDGAGGFTWTDDTPEGSGLFRAGFSITKTLVWMTGFGSPGIYHVGKSTDDGATFTWTEGKGAPINAGYAHTAVWASGPDDVWLAGIFGRLSHWNGTMWRPASIALTNVVPVTQDLTAIWGNSPNDVWVVGQDIALHKRPPQ